MREPCPLLASTSLEITAKPVAKLEELENLRGDSVLKAFLLPHNFCDDFHIRRMGKKIFTGTTPTTVTLSAGESYFHAKSYHITFSKPGYAEQYADVKATLSGWYWGNILFGGLIGMLIVDPITGKMWKLPTNVSANLSQKLSLDQNQTTLKILTLDQVPKDMRKKLVRIN